MDGPDEAGRMAPVVGAFLFDGRPVALERLPGGHIHRNLLVTCTGGRYVLQRLNQRIFPRLDVVVANGARVLTHLKTTGRRCPTLVATTSGTVSHREADGSVWRAFEFLEGTEGHEVVADDRDAFETARAFADYMVALGDLPGPPLGETIAHFHDLPRRLDQLEATAAADPVGRRAGVDRELDRARALGGHIVGARVAADETPVRIVHNDAKLSNVRFPIEGGGAACVVDLDTTMAGQVGSDVGELVRTLTTRTREDERDVAVVAFDLELLHAVAEGYFSVRPHLSSSEVTSLTLAGADMAVENGTRFLADHLAGDRYYAIERPAQNLDRCRTQLRLAELMLAREAEMAACFTRAARAAGAGS